MRLPSLDASVEVDIETNADLAEFPLGIGIGTSL